MQGYIFLKREAVFSSAPFRQYVLSNNPIITKTNYLINGKSTPNDIGKRSLVVVPYMITLKIGVNKKHEVSIVSFLKNVVAQYIYKQAKKYNTTNYYSQEKYYTICKEVECVDFTKQCRKTRETLLHNISKKKVGCAGWLDGLTSISNEVRNNYFSTISNVKSNEANYRYDDFKVIVSYFYNNCAIWKRISLCKEEQGELFKRWLFSLRQRLNIRNCEKKVNEPETDKRKHKNEEKEEEKKKEMKQVAEKFESPLQTNTKADWHETNYTKIINCEESTAHGNNSTKKSTAEESEKKNSSKEERHKKKQQKKEHKASEPNESKKESELNEPKNKREMKESREKNEVKELKKISELNQPIEKDKVKEPKEISELNQPKENNKVKEPKKISELDELSEKENMGKAENEDCIKFDELDHFFLYLQKAHDNKNSKVNVNIKLLIYIFNKFISKNKELKTKMFCSFVFLLCSKISVICTPLFLSSFIENVNLEKTLPQKLPISDEMVHIANDKKNAGFLFLTSYVLSRILSSGLTELRNAVFNNISQKIATYVSKLFFYKIHNLSLNFILSKKNGELSFIFSRGCKSVTTLLNITVFQIIPIILEFFLYLFILTYKIHYHVSLITFFNMFLYVLFTTVVTKRRTLIRKNMNRAEQNTSNIFLDSIQNIEQVKYHTNEIHELKKFSKEQKKYEKEAINVQKSLSFLNWGQQLILNFNLFVCLYITYMNILDDICPFSYLILVNTLLFQLAIPLNMFGTIYRETKLSLVDIESMIKILVKKTKGEMKNKNINTLQNGNIHFENVSFHYPLTTERNTEKIEPSVRVVPNKFSLMYQRLKKIFGFSKSAMNKTPIYEKQQEIEKEVRENLLHTKMFHNNMASASASDSAGTNNESVEEKTKEQVLFSDLKEPQYLFENFSCHIEDGELVGLLGKSGAGKSTLIKLLFKFYDINSGNIYIDNAPINDISLYALRKNICIVPQDTILFNSTIAYNIKYGNLRCSDKEMIEASVKSEMHEKILKMENKYDTIVGERGTKLSKGEAQRICIARCFLKNPKIIVLDEHVSNLDNEHKKSIDRALQNLCSGKTTIVITHLMEHLEKFNKILFFYDKTIHVGTHNELMKNNIHYKHFYNSKNNISNKLHL